jgi:hypothetical protein
VSDLYAEKLYPGLKKHYEGVLLKHLTAPSPFGQTEPKPRPWWQRLYYRYIMPIVWFARYVRAYWRDGN